MNPKNLKLFVLVKKNVNYEIKLKDKNQNDFFLIYVKYKESTPSSPNKRQVMAE